MNSGYVHNETKGSSGLSGRTTYNNLISTPYNQLRIVGRNPAMGNPSPGVPFSLVIEITSSTAEEYFDVVCPNEFVVVRDLNTRQVWASQLIRTSILEGCTGRGTLVFDPDFIPNESNFVEFEMYDDDEVTTLVDTNNVDPDVVSSPVNLALDFETGKNAGIYDKPNIPFYNREGGFFQDAERILKYTAFLTVAGAGVYFLAPFAPAIKNGFENIAERFNGEDNE